MSASRTFKLADELRGMSVLATQTSRKLGEVADALIHPTEGRMLGLTLRTAEGEERVLALGKFRIAADVIFAPEQALQPLEPSLPEVAGRVYAFKEIIGTSVVADDGKLLGHVSDVHISPEEAIVTYRVTESKMQQLFKGGYLMSGNHPHAYSRLGLRLIVPCESDKAQETTHLTSAQQSKGSRLMAELRKWIQRYGVALLFAVQALLIVWVLST